jgi:hypothetical protein
VNSAIRPQGNTFEAQIAVAGCKYDVCQRANEVHIHERSYRPYRGDTLKCFSMLFKTVGICFAIVAALENRVATTELIGGEVASDTRVVAMK